MLALTMLLSCFLVISVSAESGDTQSAIPYSKDFAKLYNEKGLMVATVCQWYYAREFLCKAD